MTGTVKMISAETLRGLSKEIEDGDCVLLDVRERHEYEAGHIPLAVLTPLSAMESVTDGIDPRTTVVVYCRSGPRSRRAADLLVSKGFQDVNILEGGIRQWESTVRTVERR